MIYFNKFKLTLMMAFILQTILTNIVVCKNSMSTILKEQTPKWILIFFINLVPFSDKEIYFVTWKTVMIYNTDQKRISTISQKKLICPPKTTTSTTWWAIAPRQYSTCSNLWTWMVNPESFSCIVWLYTFYSIFCLLQKGDGKLSARELLQFLDTDDNKQQENILKMKWKNETWNKKESSFNVNLYLYKNDDFFFQIERHFFHYFL